MCFSRVVSEACDFQASLGLIPIGEDIKSGTKVFHFLNNAERVDSFGAMGAATPDQSWIQAQGLRNPVFLF
jgi:hypothetical protein